LEPAKNRIALHFSPASRIENRGLMFMLSSGRSSERLIFSGGNIMIGVGQQAPDFELASHLAGTKFTLSQFKGQKNVLLVFYPLDWTPT